MKQIKAREFQQQCYKWLKIARGGIVLQIKTNQGFLYLTDHEPKSDSSEGAKEEITYTNYEE